MHSCQFYCDRLLTVLFVVRNQDPYFCQALEVLIQILFSSFVRCGVVAPDVLSIYYVIYMWYYAECLIYLLLSMRRIVTLDVEST